MRMLNDANAQRLLPFGSIWTRLVIDRVRIWIVRLARHLALDK